VILQPDDLPQDSQDEKHVLLTIQPRIPAASLAFPELPAGMVDDGGNFAGAAAREIKEELGNTLIPAFSRALQPNLNEYTS
jgi:8-oxo-dGTP pyrophosphatase MutT (NUDIX family)